MAADHPFWLRVLLRAASRRATDEELGDVVEEYVAAPRSAAWLVSQVLSLLRRRRSPLTVTERGAEMLSNTWTDIRYTLRRLARNPGFAAAAILPIALGLGINTGVTLSRITAGVAGSLSVLALGLAAIGVYGVVAFVVSRRRREVGVRMALGAGAEDIRRLILRQTLRPVAAGMIVGLSLAAVVVRLLQSALFGISPYDPIAFTVAPLLMLTVACAAALVPTRRALQGNPMSVLRSE